MFKGTRQYTAPEVLYQEGTSNISFDSLKADVFSLGVILYSSIIGRYPFKSATPADLRYRYVLSGDYDGFINTGASSLDQSPLSSKISAPMLQLLFKMWNPKP